MIQYESKREHNVIAVQKYNTLYVNHTAHYTYTTQSYKFYYTKLQTVLQLITLNYRQNYGANAI